MTGGWGTPRANPNRTRVEVQPRPNVRQGGAGERPGAYENEHTIDEETTDDR